MEEKKYKRKSILIVCNILLTLLLLLTTAVTITLAIQQFNMNVGGNITFNATDVQATISAGQVANGTVADSANKMHEITITPENDGATEKATWENLEITFDGLDDVIISFTVTNNHTESNLKMSLETSSINAENMTISTKIDNSNKTSVVIPKQAEGNDNKVDCQIIFHVESNLTSANIEGFSIEYTFENTEEEPASGYEVSIDSSATSLVSSLSATSVGESEQVTFTSTAKDTIGEEQITTQEIKITDIEGQEVPYTVSNLEDSTQYSFTMPASNVTISVESQTLTRITDFAISSCMIKAYTGPDTTEEVVVPATYYPYQQETGNTLRFETQEEFLSTGMSDYGLMFLLVGGHFSYKTSDSVEFKDVGNDGMTWLMETAMSFSQEQFPLEITLPTEYTLTQDDLIGGDQELVQVLSPFASIYISNNYILSFTYQIGDNEPVDVDMDKAYEMVVNTMGDSDFYYYGLLPIKYSNIKYGKTIACEGKGANIKSLASLIEIVENDDVFVNNSTVTKITIDEGVTSLGYGSIRNCAKLKEVNLPSTIDTIFDGSDQGVFSGCPLLDYNKVNNGKYLGGTTNDCLILMGVEDTSATEFVVDDSCKIINYGFEDCNNLTNVTIPTSVKSMRRQPNCSNIYYQGTIDQWLDINIGNSSYSNNDKNLYINGNQLATEITINKDINEYAFYTITSLNKVTLGENVTLIGNGAFSYCSNLDIYYQGTMDQWLEIIFDYPGWSNCNLYIDDTLVTEITINKNINDYAFYGISSLTKVTIEEGVTSIGGSAFYGSSNLDIYYQGTIDQWLEIFLNAPGWSNSDLYINDTLVTEITFDKDIESRAFSGITSLSKVTIEEGVTSIGNSVFLDCTNLTSVTIESDDIYMNSGNDVWNDAGGLLRYATTVKVRTTIVENYDNAHLENTSNFTTSTEGVYTVFTKVSQEQA